MRLAKKINVAINQEDNVEKILQRHNDDFFKILRDLNKLKKCGPILKKFLSLNNYNIYEKFQCKNSKMKNLTADCIMYGRFDTCRMTNCPGRFVYEHNKFQCRLSMF